MISGPILGGLLALSATACASVKAPQADAYAAPNSVPIESARAPIRASTPVPNPPEPADPGASGAVKRALGGYRVGKPYQIAGVWYVPAEQPDYDAVGAASWYGDAFHGRKTANGEVFDMTLSSAAHPTLPLPSVVEVTNLANDKTIQVRVNDRGPFKPGRIIDLSREAADQLGFRSQGTARVRVRYVGRAPLDPSEPIVPGLPKPEVLLASAEPLAKPAREPARRRDPMPVQASILAAFPQPVLERAVTRPGFTIQAGAFANRGNAERAAKTLGAIAPAQVLEISREGGVLYRVLVGAWTARDGATDVLNAVAQAGFPDARVVNAS